jgi:hypothetical protein
MFDIPIDERILTALQTIFTLELQEKARGDPLALNVLKQADLQDDPTTSAPYLIYKPYGGIDDGMRLIAGDETHEYGCAEIGGPIRYLYLYEAKFGAPLASTREEARGNTASLMSRIISCLIHYMDLSGVLGEGMLQSSDGKQYIEGNNNRLVRKAGFRIYGGEQTFYGEGKVYWQYPVSWLISSGSFIGF